MRLRGFEMHNVVDSHHSSRFGTSDTPKLPAESLIITACLPPPADRLPLLQKASFLRVSVDSLSLDPVFVKSVSSAPDAADTRVYLEYELPLESGTSARRSTRLGGKKIATGEQ